MSFLKSITPDGVTQALNGLQSMTDFVNPMVTDLTPDNKKIAQHLLNQGITVQEIKDFVDVSRAQLDPFLDVEAEVRKRMEAMKVSEPTSTPPPAPSQSTRVPDPVSVDTTL